MPWVKSLGNKTIKKIECNQCGWCCKTAGGWGIQIYLEDIKRWIGEKRQDILEYVDDWEGALKSGYSRDFNAIGDVTQCVFLRKDRGKKTYRCLIYETRPTDCREYPDDETEKEKCKKHSTR